jgi:hypothetical protein
VPPRPPAARQQTIGSSRRTLEMSERGMELTAPEAATPDPAAGRMAAAPTAILNARYMTARLIRLDFAWSSGDSTFDRQGARGRMAVARSRRARG